MTEETLFAAALDKPPGGDREAFLDAACGPDTALRERVAALLAADAQARGILDRPPDPFTTGGPPLATDAPFAGRFKLREKLGEGGMGEVWVADQSDPVQRRVAVPVIRPGLDSERMLARFEAERQALALMDHPNIAKFLDAGLADGRPYFVMELVRGVPITRYCDDQRLAPHDRIGLFVQVCRAVQHAHQKGVIHRDLKPSNILVATYDGAPVPKVIDFGLAKATGPRLTDRSIYTEVGALVGTLEYMSPEQAELNNLDIDTRTDVYALGAVLYELLTGAVPLPREQLRAAGLAEMLRVIKEVEPPRPSTRLSGSATAPSVAAVRRSEPRRLAALVRGELDWIVMKALEKDRGRRYESAAGLAADVERFLNHEPVQAGPPGAGYRFRKFVRRNRPQVVAAALVVLALVGGVVGTTVGLVRAEAARDREAGERTRAENALVREAAERARAEGNAREARGREAEAKAALEFVDRYVFTAPRPAGQDGGLGRDVTLLKAVEASLPYVDKGFRDQPLVEARLRMTLGRSFTYLSEARQAAAQFERARDLYTRLRGRDHPDTISAVENLALCYVVLGRFLDAVRLYETALAAQDARLGGAPVPARKGPTLGDPLLDRYAHLLPYHERVIGLMKEQLGPAHPKTRGNIHNLAVIYAHLDRHADAARLNEELLAIEKVALGPDHKDTLSTLNNLANDYFFLGRHADALKLREQIVALKKVDPGPTHPETLGAMANLSISYEKAGRHEEALKLREEVLALRKAKLGPDHRDTLASMSALGRSYAKEGRHADALKLHEEVLARQKARVGPDHPDTFDAMEDVAEALLKLGRGPDAIRVIDECLDRAAGKPARPRLVPALIALRLHHFEKAGDGAGCRATAERWERLNRTDADSLYDAGCCRAITAAVFRAAGADREAAAEADRAMDWLHKAVAAGFRDAAKFRSDTDLDALRDRDDFLAMAAGLPAAPKE